MKKSSRLIVLLTILFEVALSQGWSDARAIMGTKITEQQLPASVIKQFSKDFPQHTSDTWYTPASGIYVNTFYTDSAKNDKRIVKYDLEGKWWEKRSDIPAEELPLKIKDALAKTNPAWPIKKVLKFEWRDKPATYEVQIIDPKPPLRGYKKLLCIDFNAEGRSGGLTISEYKE